MLNDRKKDAVLEAVVLHFHGDGEGVKRVLGEVGLWPPKGGVVVDMQKVEAEVREKKGKKNPTKVEESDEGGR